MAWLVFQLQEASHAPALCQILLLIGSCLRSVASLCKGWAFPFLLSLSCRSMCLGYVRVVIKKSHHQSNFSSFGCDPRRQMFLGNGCCRAIRRSNCSSCRHTQTSYKWICLSSNWALALCVWCCHTYSAAGAGVSCPEMVLVCSLARLWWRWALGHSLGQMCTWFLLPKGLDDPDSESGS